MKKTSAKSLAVFLALLAACAAAMAACGKNAASGAATTTVAMAASTATTTAATTATPEPLGPPSIYDAEDLPANLDVYLFVGQSNMSGQAAVEPVDQFKIPHALLFNTPAGKWEDAQVDAEDTQRGLNRYSTIKSCGHLNPAFYFAYDMQAHAPGRTIGIVSNAFGGTSMAQWTKGSPKDYFGKSVEAAKAALAQGGTLRGILWHQGETELMQPTELSYYLPALNQLVDDFREALGVTAAQCPFIAGEISYTQPNGQPGSLFNSLLPGFVSKARNTDYISAAKDPAHPENGGLEAGEGGDIWHFNAASIRELGRRYAAKMVEMQKRSVVPQS